jgi:hypothetical protein
VTCQERKQIGAFLRAGPGSPAVCFDTCSPVRTRNNKPSNKIGSKSSLQCEALHQKDRSEVVILNDQDTICGN